jgi:hypothetical protein
MGAGEPTLPQTHTNNWKWVRFTGVAGTILASPDDWRVMGVPYLIVIQQDT